jgi:hypothetical protein
VTVQTVSEFDADLIDPSMSFPLPSELEDMESGIEAGNLQAVKMSSLGAARGVMVAIALELVIPLFVYFSWHLFRSSR